MADQTDQRDPGPPPATGVRLPFAGLPAGLRASIDARCGAPVVAAETQPGGFSPGVAARLTLADGRRCFVKAVHPSANPQAPDLHRREGMVVAAMPPDGAGPALAVDDRRGSGRLGRPRLRGRGRSSAVGPVAGRRAGPRHRGAGGPGRGPDAVAHRPVPDRRGRRPGQPRRIGAGRGSRMARSTGSMRGPAGTWTELVALEGQAAAAARGTDPPPPGRARGQPAPDRPRGHGRGLAARPGRAALDRSAVVRPERGDAGRAGIRRRSSAVRSGRRRRRRKRSTRC